MSAAPTSFRFVRLAEREREPVSLQIDGRPAQALAGDTLLVALLTNGLRVRDSEFDGAARAGFCLMGACQDCWVWTEAGERLRACSTPVRAGLSVLTRPPAYLWPMTPDLQARLDEEAARTSEPPGRPKASETPSGGRSTYAANGGPTSSEPPGRPKASETPSGGRWGLT